MTKSDASSICPSPLSKQGLKAPDDVRAVLKRRFANKQREWLRAESESGGWPVDVPLSIPSEYEAYKDLERVRAWAVQWKHWSGPGKVVWTERRWRDLGVQALPERILLSDPLEVASCVGEGPRWSRACVRYKEMAARWPVLKETLPQHFDVLADYPEADYRRLTDMLSWLSANPESGLYPRQIPIAGMDSKWIEARKSLITDLMRVLNGDLGAASDFFAVCGLRPLPIAVRVRVLDPRLRAHFGGLSDMLTRPEELAKAHIAPKKVLIVENLQTGLALPDLQGSVAFMRLGCSVELLASISWIQDAECIYWGDCDTHGLAILSKVRSYISSVRSIMMDEETLLAHRALWGVEEKQHSAPSLPNLQPEEVELFIALKAGRWGDRVRLEQERIAWNYALRRISP